MPDLTALAACVAAMLNLSVPDSLPPVTVMEQAKLQAIAGKMLREAHGFSGVVAGAYAPPDQMFRPEGLIILADTYRDDRSILAHELAHHIQHMNGKDHRSERYPTWVQKRVRNGECAVD